MNQTVCAKSGAGAEKRRKLEEQSAVKYFDTQINMKLVTPGVVLSTSLNPVALGSTDGTRIGTLTDAHSWRLNGVVIPDNSKATTALDCCEIVIFWDAAPNGAVPAFTDVFQQNSCPSFPNINNTSRFQVLHSELISLPQMTTDAGGQTTSGTGNEAYTCADYTQASRVVTIQKFMPPGFQTKYTGGTSTGGTIASTRSGSINIAVNSNTATAANAWRFIGTFRWMFQDAKFVKHSA